MGMRVSTSRATPGGQIMFTAGLSQKNMLSEREETKSPGYKR